MTKVVFSCIHGFYSGRYAARFRSYLSQKGIEGIEVSYAGIDTSQGGDKLAIAHATRLKEADLILLLRPQRMDTGEHVHCFLSLLKQNHDSSSPNNYIHDLETRKKTFDYVLEHLL